MAKVGVNPYLKDQNVQSWYKDEANRAYYLMADDSTANAGRHLIISTEVETGGLLPRVGLGGQAFKVFSRFDPLRNTPATFDFIAGDHTNGYLAYLSQDYERIGSRPVDAGAFSWLGLCELQDVGSGTSLGSATDFTLSADTVFSHRGSPATGGVPGAPTGYQVRMIFGLAVQYPITGNPVFFANIDCNMFVTSNFAHRATADAKVRQSAHSAGYNFVGVDANGWNDPAVATPISGDTTFAYPPTLQRRTVRWRPILDYLTTALDADAPAPYTNTPFLPTPIGGWGAATIKGWNIACEVNIPSYANTFYCDLGIQTVYAANYAWHLGTGRLGNTTQLG